MRGKETQTVFLNSAKNVINVVREEPFGVEHRLDQAGNCSQRHVLGVRVSVPLKCQDFSVWFGGEGEDQGHTSRRCLTFLTNMFPSAAKPFTAKTARSVLSGREESKIDIEQRVERDRRRTV